MTRARHAYLLGEAARGPLTQVEADECYDCGAKDRDLVSRWRRFSAGIGGSASVCADRKECAIRARKASR